MQQVDVEGGATIQSQADSYAGQVAVTNQQALSSSAFVNLKTRLLSDIVSKGALGLGIGIAMVTNKIHPQSPKSLRLPIRE